MADAALPGGETTSVFFADIPNVTVAKKFPQFKPPIHDSGFSRVMINQYTGKVLQVNKVVEPPPMGIKIAILLAAFHFGTFWGLPSQIIYVFIGLVSTVLFITGFIIWLGNKQVKNSRLRN